MLVERAPSEITSPELPWVSAEADQVLTEQIFDLEALRVVLTGASIVDAGPLPFTNRLQVDRFLRVSQFDTDNPLDLQRLSDLHQEAIVYLTDIHGYRVPLELEQPAGIHELFLATSGADDITRKMACTALKVMHILHHVHGRELLFNTSMSEAELLSRLSSRVFTVIDRMRASGITMKEFAAGKKRRSSLVTKLLAKRSNIAAHIFDKLRFRIVVDTREDVVLALLYLLRNLFPFNYVVPEQSKNGIVTDEDISQALQLPVDLVRSHWEHRAVDGGEQGAVDGALNEFSGPTYRVVNFVADIPLRIDDVLPDETPAIVFVQAEIQVVDAQTDESNRDGENSHRLYKERQRARVRRRLEGLEPV